MQRTKIEYLTHTWNPLAMRCTRVSAGCANCWHLRMADRLAGNPVIPGPRRQAYANAFNGGSPIIVPGELAEPIKIKKPAVIGVQFMGDLFHSSVMNEQIAAIFGVMAACPQHTFCVLTKRPERIVEWFEFIAQCGRMVPFHVGEEIPPGASGEAAACVMSNTTDPDLTPIEPKAFVVGVHQPWPLPNVWLGVSVEDQSTADERIQWLLKTPAAKRFVSCEPLLREVELPLFGTMPKDVCPQYTMVYEMLHLVIAGAETGPGKRPMNLEWARSLRDQCAEANVPFLFKVDSSGNHELDGRLHEEMPEIGGKR